MPPPPPERSRLRRAAARAFLSLAAVTAALLAAEVAMHLAVGKTNADVFLYTAESNRYKIMKSGYEAHCYGVPVATNNLGYRDDRKTVPAKGENQFRVVVLGDSYTVCMGVPFDQVFTERIEAGLAPAFAKAGLTLDVVNMGVAGYGALHHYHNLVEAGLRLAPDLVLLACFPSNDFQSDDYRRHRDIALGNLPVPRPGLRDKCYLWQAVAPSLSSIRARLRPSVATASGTNSPPAGPEGEDWAANAAALVDMQRVAGEAGAPFLVFLLPANWNYAVQEPGHARVVAFCGENGIDCTDILPVFEEKGAAPSSYAVSLIDKHPNAAYNAIVAHSILQRLRAHPRIETALARGATP